jgi:hypothetical protein
LFFQSLFFSSPTYNASEWKLCLAHFYEFWSRLFYNVTLNRFLTLVLTFSIDKYTVLNMLARIFAFNCQLKKLINGEIFYFLLDYRFTGNLFFSQNFDLLQKNYLICHVKHVKLCFSLLIGLFLTFWGSETGWVFNPDPARSRVIFFNPDPKCYYFFNLDPVPTHILQVEFYVLGFFAGSLERKVTWYKALNTWILLTELFVISFYLTLLRIRSQW